MEENQNIGSQGKKPNLLMVGVGGIVLLAIAAGAVVLTRGNQSNQTQTDSNVSEDTSDTAGAINPELIEETAGAEMKVIGVEGGSFYYKPNEIRVKKGDEVKIALTAKDMMHDFNIDELEVKIPVTKAGDTSTIQFTADKVGEFEYYCSVGNHKQQGQIGKLIVTE